MKAIEEAKKAEQEEEDDKALKTARFKKSGATTLAKMNNDTPSKS